MPNEIVNSKTHSATVKHHKFLPLEAEIYEKFKTGMTLKEVSRHYKDDNKNFHSRLRRLINVGAISKTGSKAHHCVYTVHPITYELREKRCANKEDRSVIIEDRLITSMINFKLNVMQMEKLMSHKAAYDTGEMCRKELASKVGVTKLQLNMVLENMGKLKTFSTEEANLKERVAD